MIKKIKELYIKYKEPIVYMLFGGVATAIDFLTYIFLTRFFEFDESTCNVIAQLIAVVAAFFLNKIFVFKDTSFVFKTTLIQFVEFCSLRILTVALNSLLFWIFVDIFTMHDILIKVLVSVLIVILNYFFSKLIVFKKKAR